MKFYLIMETEIAEGVTDAPTIMKVIEDDAIGKATLSRARSVARAISGMNSSQPVQVAVVKETVKAQ